MGESVDADILTTLQEIMEDDFHALVTTFLDDSEMRIPQLRVQLAAADSEALRLTAHSLKGSSGNLGAKPLSNLCLFVEQRAAAQQLDGLEDALDDIDEEFARVAAILSRL